MSRILVTGGAGFIGSHLTQSLVEQGNEVIVMDTLLRGNKLDKEIYNAVHFVKEDVRDAAAVMKYSKNCDYIFHLAAILGVDVVADKPIETMETEFLGMKNMADAAIENKVQKIIYASTSGVYGHSAIERSVTENIQLDPRTSYAIAKRFNEIYLAALFEEKGVESISLRFFNVYGTKQDNRMVIPRFFEQAIRNEPITVFGSGSQTRDFTSVEDTVKASIELAEKVNGCEIFNIANENEVSILDLAKTIVEITNSKSTISYIDAPSKRYDFEVERRFGNSEKLYIAIGFKPSTPLKEGLTKIFHSH
jgi:UDP-glucose 4-epimerase